LSKLIEDGVGREKQRHHTGRATPVKPLVKLVKLVKLIEDGVGREKQRHHTGRVYVRLTLTK
jgi:hypothetical protein